jgi:demethylmenaquinone methyltransferase / 2-methoxy-6-polyprenyl-1,4-benzoquinol methylase
VTRAHLDRRPDEVAAMFDRTAERYDLVNDVLSAGQDRLWRRAVARALRPYLPGGPGPSGSGVAPGSGVSPRDGTGAGAGGMVLDVAAGTGTSARAFAAAGARCVACDFSLGMLRVGRRRLAARPACTGDAHAGGVTFAAGDALALPFGSESFDAVTISFGLRNVAAPEAALAEMLRVTKPGGGLVICEFSHLPFGPAEALYRRYIAAVLPAVARRVSSNPEAYEYLAESIEQWPQQRELARWIGAAGWSGVRWRNLSFGIVALHSARRPAK